MSDPSGSSTEPRPRIAAEVRAWAVVAVAIIVQLVGTVWWAATLSAQVESLRESMRDLKSAMAQTYTSADAGRDMKPLVERLIDHEARLRQLEGNRR